MFSPRENAGPCSGIELVAWWIAAMLAVVTIPMVIMMKLG